MKLLLDTCALLWLARDPSLLSEKARVVMRAHAHAWYVSAISAFEIASKCAKGNLDVGLPPDVWWSHTVQHYRLHVLHVTDSICLASTALPRLHADPCDRIIMATACGIGAEIVTSDRMIRQYPEVNVLW